MNCGMHGADQALFSYTSTFRANHAVPTSPIAQRLESELAGAEVTCIASSNVLFLLAGQSRHKLQLEVSRAAFQVKWSPRVAIHTDWFKNATIEQLARVERPTSNHLHWPDLDIDLPVESLRDPAAFALRAKSAA